MACVMDSWASLSLLRYVVWCGVVANLGICSSGGITIFAPGQVSDGSKKGLGLRWCSCCCMVVGSIFYLQKQMLYYQEFGPSCGWLDPKLGLSWLLFWVGLDVPTWGAVWSNYWRDGPVGPTYSPLRVTNRWSGARQMFLAFLCVCCGLWGYLRALQPLPCLYYLEYYACRCSGLCHCIVKI